MKAGRYRKLIAAVVGMVALVAGVEFAPEGVETIVNAVVVVLTAFGVWAVPNDA